MNEILAGQSVLDKLNATGALCPWKCQGKALDERGYCEHLVGFSNDGETYEPLKAQLYARGPLKGEATGLLFVDGRDPQPVREGDLLVNPEEPQLDKGVYHMKKAWVSARVYRKAGRPLTEAEEEILTRPQGE